MDNLIKNIEITVSWSKFVKINQIDNKYLVEAYDIPINIEGIIISIIPIDSKGYNEYALLRRTYKSLICGQILDNIYCNEGAGDMTVRIFYV